MVSSHSSTACVSPVNDTVEKVIKNDTVRYKRKGFGLIIAAIQAIAYFTFLPPFLESIYPSLIAGWDHRWFSCFSITLVHMTANLSFYLLSYFIYKAKSPFLERYKSTDEPWPWESDPKEWKEMLRKSVMLFLFNNLVVAPLLTIGDTVLGGVTLRTTTNVYPSMKDTLLQILFCMIVEDFCFYCGHRLLHHRALYPHIHKIHHQYNQTISIANEYAHPVEFLISNLIPSTLGPKLLGKQMHITTFWIWVIMRVGESVDGHCGYDFSWSPFRLLPLSGSATYHAYHHSANVGNYCSLFTFWDTVFQTNRDYWLWLSKHQKEEVLKDTAANVKGQVAPVSKTIDGVSKAAGKDLLKHQKDE